VGGCELCGASDALGAEDKRGDGGHVSVLGEAALDDGPNLGKLLGGGEGEGVLQGRVCLRGEGTGGGSKVCGLCKAVGVGRGGVQ
jgi:hypothetical protein